MIEHGEQNDEGWRRGEPVGDPFDHDQLDEDPSEEDITRFSAESDRCYQCGAELYEDTALCPECGAFQVESEAPRRADGVGPFATRPWLVIIVALLTALGLILWAIA